MIQSWVCLRRVAKMKVFFFNKKINVRLNARNLQVIFKDVSAKLGTINVEPIQDHNNPWKLLIQTIEKSIKSYLKL